MNDFVEVLKVMGEPIRIRMLNLLRHHELCVCDIMYILGITQSNASRHLDRLKKASIITYRKDAQWIYYKLDSNILDRYTFIACVINEASRIIEECSEDLRMLNELKSGKLTCEQLKGIAGRKAKETRRALRCRKNKRES